VLLDIDFFKAFNDNYGHLKGDECLIKIGQLIRGFGKRPGDLVARYGGEEFAVILADTDSNAAAAIAEKIRVAVCDLGIRHGYSDVDSKVTVSIGLATNYPQRKASETDIIKAADEALYESKQAGRNRVTISKRTARA
jgi:diguanylate cyclase (GGDEF)-like protein